MEEEREMTVTERIMLETDDIYTGSPSAEQEISDAQLHVEPWNRTTIADGLWLQENAIAPFSARDIMLANEIDKTNERVSELEENATDGREVRSFSPRIWSGDNTSWRNIHNTRVIPDDELIPKNSVMYMPMVYSSPTHGETSEGGVLSMNSKTKSFQLEINEAGVFWDFGDPNNTTTTVNGDYGSFEVDTKSGKHSMKILSEADKNGLNDKFWLLTSAGYQKFGIDENELKWDSDNKLTLKHYPSEWVVTDDYAINSSPSNNESFLHGGDLHVASAARSTIGIGQIIADEGTYINQSIIHGSSLHVTNSAAIDTSLIMALGGTVSGNVEYSLLMNHNLVNKISNAIIGGSGSVNAEDVNTAILWGWGNYYKDTNMLHVGGSCYTSGNNGTTILGGGGNYLYDNTEVLAVFNGTSACSAKYSMFVKAGGKVVDSDRSLIIEDSGRYLEDVHTSLVAANFKNIYGEFDVSNINDSVIAASAQLRYGALASVIASDNFAFDYASPGQSPISAGLYVGHDIHYKGGTANVIAVGSNLAVKGSNSLVVGNNNTSYGIDTFMYGYDNTVEYLPNNSASAASISMGIGNWQGYGGSIQIGNENKSNDAWNFTLGFNNFTQGKFAKIFGDRNTSYDHSFIIGNDNYTYRNDTYILGHNNTSNYGQNIYSIGYYNKSFDDDVFMMGTQLRAPEGECVVLGKYNFYMKDSILEVGYGDPGTNTRKTMFRVDKNGDVWIAGNIHCNDISAHSTTTNISPPVMHGNQGE